MELASEGRRELPHALRSRGAWLGEVQRDAVVVAHGGVSRVLRGLVLRLEDSEIPHLEVPQDKVLILRDGKARWL